MWNPLENFGDYNIARDALKAANGCWETVKKDIIAGAAPKFLIIGGAVVLGVTGLGILGYKTICSVKDEKRWI